MLEIKNLCVNYGHVQAVRNVSMSLRQGGITALVGANGAGKSSTLLALSGLVAKKGGAITLLGSDITRLPAHEIVKRGMVQIAEGRATLTTLSVQENLELGAYRQPDKAAQQDDMERVFEMFPRLRERRDGLAGNLSGGEQQMLAIGRALMARPKLLLLDEPSMGLAPIIVQDIFRILRQINRMGLTLLLVEQNVRQALRLCDDAYVMENGEIVLQGNGSELLHDPAVQRAYLGG